MLTGDSYRTAAAIAAQVGVDDFRAGVLPADKAEYVARLRREGHTVLMVGDGIQRLAGPVPRRTRALHQRRRRHRPGDRGHHHCRRQPLGTGGAAPDRHGADGAHPLNYRFVIGFNGTLIALGVAGVLPPATSATLHNLSTLGVSLRSMGRLALLKM